MPIADKVYTLKDVSSHDFVVEYAQHLKKTGKMEVPKWVDLAKTGPLKELAPYDEDFYYIRAGAFSELFRAPHVDAVSLWCCAASAGSRRWPRRSPGALAVLAAAALAAEAPPLSAAGGAVGGRCWVDQLRAGCGALWAAGLRAEVSTTALC